MFSGLVHNLEDWVRSLYFLCFFVCKVFEGFEFSWKFGHVETFMILFHFQSFQGWSTIGEVGLGWAMFLLFLYARFSGFLHNR